MEPCRALRKAKKNASRAVTITMRQLSYKPTLKFCHAVRRGLTIAIRSYARGPNVAKVHHIDGTLGRFDLQQRTSRGLHDYHTMPSMSSGSAFFLRGPHEYIPSTPPPPPYTWYIVHPTLSDFLYGPLPPP